MKIFNTVADLQAAKLTADQMVSVKEVGEYRIKASGSGVTLANGNIAVPVASGTSVNVKQFGAVGDGVTDDTSAIQAAFDALKYVTRDTAYTGGYTYNGYQQNIYFPKGTYLVSSTITNTASYLDIDFGGSIFKADAGFTAGTFLFNFSSLWVGRVRNIKAFGFPKVFNIANPNNDAGVINFENIEISGGDLAFNIDARSTRTLVRNGRFDRVKQVALVDSGDKVIFESCWVNPGVMANNYDGVFEIMSGSNSAGLELVDVFWVPRAQTASDCVCVKMSDVCRVTIDRCMFGAESGGLPLVANYADASASGARGSHITISNSLVYSSSTGGRAMVELYGLPNSLVFSNVYGLHEESHTTSLFDYRTDFRSFATADAARAGTCEIWLEGRQVYNWRGLPRAERAGLNQFIRSRGRFYHNYTDAVTNTVGFTIPELSTGALKRGQTWRIRLTNPSNPGIDRYSEYILQGDYTGTTLGLLAVSEGTSTVAPRVSINGSTFEIKTNGSTGNNNFAYDLEKICDPSEGYL